MTPSHVSATVKPPTLDVVRDLSLLPAKLWVRGAKYALGTCVNLQ
jgi:hypothetical protein